MIWWERLLIVQLYPGYLPEDDIGMPVLSYCPKICALREKFNTDIARNTQYIVIFRSPSDRKQVDILADRIFAKRWPKFMDVYEQETEKPYGSVQCWLIINREPRKNNKWCVTF